MLLAYREHVAERAALGIPPLPLSKKQTEELIELLLNPPKGEEQALVELITYRVPAGVDDAAEAKAAFLAKVAKGETACALISREKATELLGTMLGGYNVQPLIDLLDDAKVGAIAAKGLSGTLLVFDAFHDVKEKADKGNANAKAVMQSWAEGEWFTSRPEVPQSLTVTVFKVTGETNTDDLSPAPDAWSRPDIPLHAAGHAEESARRHRSRQGRRTRPDQAARRAEGQGQPGRLRRRRGRHRLLAQIGHQQRAVVHRRGHSVRAEQALRRRLPRQQDRPDLLQHHGRRRRAADRTRRVEDGHGRRRRTASLRRQGAEERRSHRRVQGQDRRHFRRSARRRPHSADHRPRPHRQRACRARHGPLAAVPPSGRAGRFGQGLLARAEDGRPRLRSAGRQRASVPAPTANRR